MTTTRYSALLVFSLVFFAGCVAPGDSEPPAQSASEGATTLDAEHDYAAEQPSSETFTIPDSAASYDLTAKMGGEGPTVCKSTNDARLVVRSPSGEKYVDLTSRTGGNVVVSTGTGNSGCSRMEVRDIHLDVGTWTVEFTGSGPFTGGFHLNPTVS